MMGCNIEITVDIISHMPATVQQCSDTASVCMYLYENDTEPFYELSHTRLDGDSLFNSS